MDDFSIIAPFFFDVNTQNSAGSIKYEVHTEGQILNVVSTFVTRAEGIQFKATWMLLVYWDAVPAFGGPKNQVCLSGYTCTYKVSMFIRF